MKKYEVTEACIHCGVCESLCADVFKQDDAGDYKAFNDNLNDDNANAAETARTSCPTEAIIKVE